MLIAVREGPVPSVSVFLSHRDLTSSQRCNPVVIGWIKEWYARTGGES